MLSRVQRYAFIALIVLLAGCATRPAIEVAGNDWQLSEYTVRGLHCRLVHNESRHGRDVLVGPDTFFLVPGAMLSVCDDGDILMYDGSYGKRLPSQAEI